MKRTRSRPHPSHSHSLRLHSGERVKRQKVSDFSAFGSSSSGNQVRGILKGRNPEENFFPLIDSPSSSQEEKCNQLQLALFLMTKNEYQNIRFDPAFILKIFQTFHQLCNDDQIFQQADYEDLHRHIATVLHRLGLLAKTDRLKRQQVNGPIIESLLKRLGEIKNTVAQDIVSPFYGLGELAKAGCLRKQVIDGCIINPLLECFLKMPGVIPQDIADLLHGLGGLAKSDCLQEQLIQGDTLNELLHRFASMKDATPLHKARALHAVAELAKAGCLGTQIINNDIINTLLDGLADMGSDISLDILSALHSVRDLVTAGCLKRLVIGDGIIHNLLDCLLAWAEMDDAKPLDYFNVLYSVNVLANADCLRRQTIDGRIISKLLDHLAAMEDATPKNIVDTLNNVKDLAKAGCLRGQVIDGCIINRLLNRLADMEDATPKNIAISLHDVNVLVKAACLQGQVIDGRTIDHLLNRLADMEDATPKDIAITLCSVGVLAKTGCLRRCVIKSDAINKLLALLDRLEEIENPVLWNITDTFYGLGNLATAGYLKGQVIDDRIIRLLKRLMKSDTPKDIAGALYHVGMLVGKGHLKKQEQKKIVLMLLKHFSNMPDKNVAELCHQTAIGCYFIFGLMNPPTELAALKRIFEKEKPKPESCQNKIQLHFKGQGIAIEAEGLVGAFYVDLLFPKKKLIIELDSPRHYLPDGELREKDKIRDTWLSQQGYTVVRIKYDECYSTQALIDRIDEILFSHQHHGLAAKEPSQRLEFFSKSGSDRSSSDEPHWSSVGASSVVAGGQHGRLSQRPGFFSRRGISSDWRHPQGSVGTSSFAAGRQPSVQPRSYTSS